MNIHKLEQNLYKYYFLLKTEHSFEAIFKYFDEFDKFIQDELIESFGNMGDLDIKNQKIENDIFNSFKVIKTLDLFDIDVQKKTYLDFLIANDAYLDNVFNSYNFSEEDEKFILCKYDLNEILKLRYNNSNKLQLIG
jgi:hypothetical protein